MPRTQFCYYRNLVIPYVHKNMEGVINTIRHEQGKEDNKDIQVFFMPLDPDVDEMVLTLDDITKAITRKHVRVIVECVIPEIHTKEPVQLQIG